MPSRSGGCSTGVTSSATWKVLAQQVFFARRDFQPGPGEGLFSMDAWDGYVASRDRILRFVQERGTTKPVVLTGDVHSNWAGSSKPTSPTRIAHVGSTGVGLHQGLVHGAERPARPAALGMTANPRKTCPQRSARG